MNQERETPFDNLPNPSNDAGMECENRGRRIKRLLTKPEALSDAELHQLLMETTELWVFNPPPDYLTARVAIELMFAIRRMDVSSSRAAKRIIQLTWGIAILTVGMFVQTCVIIWKAW